MPVRPARRAERPICFSCVGQRVIKIEIRATGTRQRCHYCRDTRQCITLEMLARRIDPVYSQNVERSTDEEFVGMSGDDPIFHFKGSPPDEIIADMLETGRDIALDIANHLSEGEGPFPGARGEEPMYDAEGAYLVRAPTGEHHTAAWERFVISLKQESRFFRHGGAAVLNELFRGISELPYRGRKAPVREITPTSKERWVYRARRANMAADRIRMLRSPADELGPPPNKLAVAGRMNAAGIPAFYGAFDPETCVSELRLGIGEIAVCCKFEITRPVRVLDLTALKNIKHGSTLFDPDYRGIAERLAFLRSFEAAISRPVHTGAEMEYLPTQALAEYLAFEQIPSIDGVIYASTQNPAGRPNLALFAHAAGVAGRVAEAPARFVEYWDADRYQIWDYEGARDAPQAFRYFDAPTPTTTPASHLRVCPDALTVHKIGAVHHSIATTPVDSRIELAREMLF